MTDFRRARLSGYKSVKMCSVDAPICDIEALGDAGYLMRIGQGRAMAYARRES